MIGSPDRGPPSLDPGAVRANAAEMFVTFFHELKAAGVPVTLREYLTLMEAMQMPTSPAAGSRISTISRARR